MYMLGIESVILKQKSKNFVYGNLPHATNGTRVSYKKLYCSIYSKVNEEYHFLYIALKYIKYLPYSISKFLSIVIS